MKLQLDTTKKTIKVEESVKLVKFMDTVKKLLPNNEWKEFTLETGTTISYGSYPVYVEKWHEPWYQRPWYWCNTTVGGNNLNLGINTLSGKTMSAQNSNSLSMKTTAQDLKADYSLNAGVYNIETKD